METSQIARLDPTTGYADHMTRQARFTRNGGKSSQNKITKNQLRLMETSQIAHLDPLTIMKIALVIDIVFIFSAHHRTR